LRIEHFGRAFFAVSGQFNVVGSGGLT